MILALVVCTLAAEQPRQRQRLSPRKLQPLRQRSKTFQKRVSARQEAVTPYPTADELKPEVPFEEGNQPDEVYGPPDETYGPPELDQTPADQLPSEEAPEEFSPNPDAEEFQPALEGEEEQPSRLTTSRKSNKKRIASRLVQKKKSPKSQRLVVAPIAAAPAPVALPFNTPSYAVQPQQYFLLNQPFAYTAHYQAW